MEKWWRERWVCAPQSRSCGTRTAPIESVSMRYFPPSITVPAFSPVVPCAIRPGLLAPRMSPNTRRTVLQKRPVDRGPETRGDGRPDGVLGAGRGQARVLRLTRHGEGNLRGEAEQLVEGREQRRRRVLPRRGLCPERARRREHHPVGHAPGPDAQDPKAHCW